MRQGDVAIISLAKNLRKMIMKMFKFFAISKISPSHLNNGGHAFEQLNQLSVAVVSYAALLPKVVVIRRHELAKVHSRLWAHFQQFNHFFCQRLGRGQCVVIRVE